MNPLVTRKNVLQQLFLSIGAIGLSSLVPENVFSQNDPYDPLLPFYIPPAAALQPGPIGIDIRTLIRSSQTNKQFSCVEFAVAPKKMGPAPHYHRNLDELMYVLEGTISIMVDNKVYDVEAGGWHLRPRGIVHTFFNKTDKPARGIDMYFNQNFEDYLEELFHSILPDMNRQHLNPSDPGIAKRMHELHDKFGMVGFPEQRKIWIERFGLME